jgi:ABC-type Na+ efflux pump permease subunit
LIRSYWDPRPNFWAVTVTGTWSDFYNRGFCRLRGDEAISQVWAGEHGPIWAVSTRCVRLFVELFWVGVVLTLATVIALLHTAVSHFRSGGRRGSLVLPVASILVVSFVMMFALVYPLDNNAVLNPRYLLPIATPMTACFGLGLSAFPTGRWKSTLVHLLAFAAIIAVTVLVVVERFGR